MVFFFLFLKDRTAPRLEWCRERVLKNAAQHRCGGKMLQNAVLVQHQLHKLGSIQPRPGRGKV